MTTQDDNPIYLDTVSKVLDENKDAFSDLLKDLQEYGATITKFTETGLKRIHPLSREGITITIQHEHRKRNTLETGQLIKVKWIKSKRIFIKVTQGGYYDAKGISVYKPSPKSTLRNKTKFSKVKATIIK